MQCKHCGSIIRDNVKYCTQCGRSVLEIRNNIINNETTEKIKEQFKNVSSNVVENVKNFDTEQAKQQTINFANNVKTDVKNFKTLSIKKKRIYVITLVAIILVVFFIGKGLLGGGSSKINSSEFISKVQSVARQNENAAWKFNDYTIYNTLSNGNPVILIEYKAIYDYDKYYLLVEFNLKDNSVVKKTNVFPGTTGADGIKVMYSTKWK